MSAFRNIHGRRPGRGIRPWLLGPKVLCVGVYFGGLVAAAVICSLAELRAAEGVPPADLLYALRLLFLCVVVPALLGAMFFGTLLFFQHPRQFLRLRWWQVKMALVAVMVPTAHLYMSARLASVRNAASEGIYHDTALRQFNAALWLLLGLSAAVILIGRLKPRLGQNWAKTYGGSANRSSSASGSSGTAGPTPAPAPSPSSDLHPAGRPQG